MKLIDLIDSLFNPRKLKKLITELGLNTESEALLVYMKENLNMAADIQIFEVEETEDEMFFEKDGIKYIQLFPIEHIQNLIEFDLNMKNKGFSEIQVVEKLLEYRKHDA
ncbi:hypothetical protein [Flavobacterium nitrogenifigens]|uniref:Uncharacterized protein n=1 Tax=Flavobacterium nitrogenifigens TaxID=1617283 RepID=A0A521EUH7_9FLAO|nr:hypothetical protein [Flavobacterium nitrogenifigens]KAF2333395.1 hypothetical protein DM397_09650 [Flavobacterium nitrogenifigens]SMO87565.1 hypothetical protein SAMN06265220_105122 [Flavobacterium nitrogenifigens]